MKIINARTQNLLSAFQRWLEREHAVKELKEYFTFNVERVNNPNGYFESLSDLFDDCFAHHPNVDFFTLCDEYPNALPSAPQDVGVDILWAEELLDNCFENAKHAVYGKS